MTSSPSTSWPTTPPLPRQPAASPRAEPAEAASAELFELAHAYGVAAEVVDWHGQPASVPAATLRSVLRAMGVPADSPAEIVESLTQRDLAPWRRTLPACVVLRQERGGAVRLVTGTRPLGSLTLEFEDGYRQSVPIQGREAGRREVDGRERVALDVRLPARLPLGWHRLRFDGPDPAECRIVVTPDRLELPTSLATHGAWGFWLQLYAVRSRNSWGIGDLADLADVAERSARELGAGFVLVNPLHAGEPVAPLSASPYLPRSRRFAHPLYLHIESLPEYAELSVADQDRIAAWAAAPRANNDQDVLDRDLTWDAKRAALELLYDQPRDPQRQRGYEEYLTREGEGVWQFATWNVLCELHGPSWLNWPDELRDPRSAAVAEVRRTDSTRVDFWCWVQWLLDGQLAATQQSAREAGMSVGIVHDLAVGASPDSADAWAMQHVLATGVSVGAPADAFNQQGQDWNQPPWLPERLAEVGYEPYRLMLRGILRHAGGLRIDHVLGLFRLWWVPQGRSPAAGTYVYYDAEALLGILALEARRAGALVVGEDLGVVTEDMRRMLAERGILGNSILWFEMPEGAPRAPQDWRRLCLATVGTHDLPPTAGWLTGEHMRVRHELGLLTRDWDEEVAENDATLSAWLADFRDRGFLPAEDARVGGSVEAQVLAAHRYLAQTPSVLASVGLPDVAGDLRMINQPGTDTEHPNWRRPMAGPDGKPVLLEDVLADPRTREVADIMAGRAWAIGTPGVAGAGPERS